jgi:hypothetical protein
MEKIIKFLPVMAILLASGLAVATTSTTTYNVYWDGSNWESIPPGQTVNCDSNPNQNCKAFRNAQGHISDIVKGDRLP